MHKYALKHRQIYTPICVSVHVSLYIYVHLFGWEGASESSDL